MVTPLAQIEKYPGKCKNLLGISYEQFSVLVQQAQKQHKLKQEEIEQKKIRLNRKGAGRKPSLSVKAEVCLCLFYLRQLPTFEVLGMNFNVSKSTANNIFNYWLEILEELLPSSLLEEVKKNEVEWEVVQELLTEYEVIVDSYEQSRERPGEYDQQKKYYSGKKKNHTFKNHLSVLECGKDIVDVSNGNRGPESDVEIYRQNLSKFDSHQSFVGDKAYQGGERMTSPQKKPKNRELTSEQKHDNKLLSQKRIFVEHVIRLIKIFRVATERFRLCTRKYQRVINTVCGLVRLRIGTLIFSV